MFVAIINTSYPADINATQHTALSAVNVDVHLFLRIIATANRIAICIKIAGNIYTRWLSRPTRFPSPINTRTGRATR